MTMMTMMMRILLLEKNTKSRQQTFRVEDIYVVMSKLEQNLECVQPLKTLAGGEVQRLFAPRRHLTTFRDDLHVDVGAQQQQLLDKRRLVVNHRQTQRRLQTTSQIKLDNFFMGWKT